MICPACSTQVDENANYCVSCGYTLRSQADRHAPHPGSNPYTGQTFLATSLILLGVGLAIGLERDTVAHLMIAGGFVWFIGIRMATR